jgi:hypothetical protein
MEVKINVSEDQFKELLEKELKNLSKETIQNILVECIKGYFSEDNKRNLENIFLVRGNSYGTSYQPSRFLESILEKCDFSGLQEVVDNCIKDLKENYDHILIKVLSSMISESLSSTYNFKYAVQNEICNELARRDNNNF